MADRTVALGLELLERLEPDEVPLATAVDCLETITTDPATTRRILDAAERRGLLDRRAGIVRPKRGVSVRFESEVVSRDGEFACRRCGQSLSEGYFLRLDAGEVGPFGSTCIRTVTGRE